MGQICSQFSDLSCIGHISLHGFAQLPTLLVHQEGESAVPSVQVNLHCCRRVWRQVRATLMRSSLQSQKQANLHRVPGQLYRAGQKLWLFPSRLNQGSWHPGLWARSRWIGWSMPPQLPALLKIHPTSHVSWVKPVRVSELVVPHDGRGTVRRRGLGCPGASSLTKTCCAASTRTIQKNQVGRQKAPVKGGYCQGSAVSLVFCVVVVVFSIGRCEPGLRW